MSVKYNFLVCFLENTGHSTKNITYSLERNNNQCTSNALRYSRHLYGFCEIIRKQYFLIICLLKLTYFGKKL